MRLPIKSSFLAIFAILVSFSSCVNNEVTEISLNKSTISFNVGQSDSVVASLTINGDITKIPLTFSVSDTKIASVKESVLNSSNKQSKTGSAEKTIIITALKSGSTTLTINTGGKTTSCTINVSQRNLTFTSSVVSNYGDTYDIGNNNYDMYLLENGLTVDADGKIGGNGTFLYVDFEVSITQSTLSGGYFTPSFSGDVNTFFPGSILVSQGNRIAIGTILISITPTDTTTSFIRDGYYTVTPTGDNYLISGDLITETKEVIHFTYNAPVTVRDKQPVPIQVTPNLTKGELIYFGDAYNTSKSNNFIAYLASDKVNFKESTRNGGELIALELNTSLSTTDSIPSGTYNMMPELKTSYIVPYSLIPAYSPNDSTNWGCWYYGTSTIKIKTGNIQVSKVGNKYSINYELYDRFGSKVSGVYSDTLSYIDATKQSSIKGMYGNRKPSNTIRKFLDKKSPDLTRIKPFQLMKRPTFH